MARVSTVVEAECRPQAIGSCCGLLEVRSHAIGDAVPGVLRERLRIVTTPHEGRSLGIAQDRDQRISKRLGLAGGNEQSD